MKQGLSSTGLKIIPVQPGESLQMRLHSIRERACTLGKVTRSSIKVHPIAKSRSCAWYDWINRCRKRASGKNLSFLSEYLPQGLILLKTWSYGIYLTGVLKLSVCVVYAYKTVEANLNLLGLESMLRHAERSEILPDGNLIPIRNTWMTHFGADSI